MSTVDRSDGTGAPAVTVVVPTYARPERLAQCVAALRALRPPPGGAEVVIVDDGSPVPAAEVVGPGDGAIPIVVHRQANAGPAAARNAGADRARGRLLAFTDDDCTPDPGWLEALVAAADRHPGAMLGGRTVNGVDDDPYAWASQVLVDHVCAATVTQDRFVPSNNLAVPAEGYAAIGGFDTSFPLAAGEDRDLCARWLDTGAALVPVDDAVVVHHHHFTFRGYLRQHHAYGRGGHRFQERRREIHGAGLRPEPIRFYTGLLRRPFREPLPTRRAAAVAGLLVVSQVANASGFAREVLRSRRRG